MKATRSLIDFYVGGGVMTDWAMHRLYSCAVWVWIWGSSCEVNIGRISELYITSISIIFVICACLNWGRFKHWLCSWISSLRCVVDLTVQFESGLVMSRADLVSCLNFGLEIIQEHACKDWSAHEYDHNTSLYIRHADLNQNSHRLVDLELIPTCHHFGRKWGMIFLLGIYLWYALPLVVLP